MAQTAILPVSIVLFVDRTDAAGVRLWMQVREVEGPLFGLWEFPGGKIEVGETPAQAAAREVHEEVGVTLEGAPLFFKFHPYTNVNGKNIGLYVFLARHSSLPVGEKTRWFELERATKSAPLKGSIPEVNHGIVDEAVEYLCAQSEGDAWEQVWA